MSKIIYDNDDLTVYVKQGVSVNRSEIDTIISYIATYIGDTIDQEPLNNIDVSNDLDSIADNIVELYDKNINETYNIVKYILTNEFELHNLVQQIDNYIQGSIIDQDSAVKELLETGTFNITDNVIYKDDLEYNIYLK